MEKKRQWMVGRILIASVMMGLFALAMVGIVPVVLRLQFVPAVIRAVSIASMGAIALLAVLVLLSFVFGRFYCSVICPLGIVQDILYRVTRGRIGKGLRHETWVRYFLAGLVFGALGYGWAWGLQLLDPYSISGRIVTWASLAGWVAIVGLFILCVWQKRVFCATLCPVGVVLGLLSKFGIYRLKIAEKCVKCGRCVASCPGGCIDLQEKTIDNERCVRCMSCVSTCPMGAITLGAQKPSLPNRSRREFLVKGALLVAGVGSGIALTKVGKAWVESKVETSLFLPPGAGNRERFTAKCTGCQLCVNVCPTKIIRPVSGGLGPVVLDLSLGSCRYDCNACMQACPTGALQPLSLATKQKTKIAVAKFDSKKCKVFQEEEPCGDCVKACPTDALILRKTGAPRLKKALCIGCGACQEACPSAAGKAMIILPIEQQEQVEEQKA